MPKTLIGNIKIANAAPTEKEKNMPWTFPYSGFSLGNSLRNAYWYSQNNGGSLVSLTFPFVTTQYGSDVSSLTPNAGIQLTNTYQQLIRRQRIYLPPMTHLRAEWSYEHTRLSGEGDLTIRLELTGASITEVSEDTTSIALWRNDDDPRKQTGFLDSPATARVQRIYKENYLLPISGNQSLCNGDVWLNVYVKGTVNSAKNTALHGILKPITFDLYYRNLPQGDET